MWSREKINGAWARCFRAKNELSNDKEDSAVVIFEKKVVNVFGDVNGYIGNVFSIDADNMSVIYDEDIDVLKVKCLLAAKKYGWQINQMV